MHFWQEKSHYFLNAPRICTHIWEIQFSNNLMKSQLNVSYASYRAFDMYNYVL